MSTHRLGVAILVLISLLWGPAALADESAAKATIDKFHASLIAIMKDGPSLGFEGRRNRLRPVIDEAFDLTYISRSVLARHWKNLSPAKRQSMQGGFADLAIATLASQFDSYAGEVFEAKSTRPLKKARVLVKSDYRLPGGEVLSVDFALQQRSGSWKIINVWFEGVSESRIRRQEYSSIIESGGVEALEKKIADLIAGYAQKSN